MWTGEGEGCSLERQGLGSSKDFKVPPTPDFFCPELLWRRHLPTSSHQPEKGRRNAEHLSRDLQAKRPSARGKRAEWGRWVLPRCTPPGTPSQAPTRGCDRVSPHFPKGPSRLGLRLFRAHPSPNRGRPAAHSAGARLWGPGRPPALRSSEKALVFELPGKVNR